MSPTTPLYISIAISLTGLFLTFIAVYIATKKYMKESSDQSFLKVKENFVTVIQGLESNLDIRLSGLEEHINTKIRDVKKDVADHRLDMREMKVDFKEMIKDYDFKAHKRIDEVVHRVKQLEFEKK